MAKRRASRRYGIHLGVPEHPDERALRLAHEKKVIAAACAAATRAAEAEIALAYGALSRQFDQADRAYIYGQRPADRIVVEEVTKALDLRPHTICGGGGRGASTGAVTTARLRIAHRLHHEIGRTPSHIARVLQMDVSSIRYMLKKGPPDGR